MNSPASARPTEGQRRPQLWRILTFLLILSVTAVACGSDEGSDTGPSTAGSEGAFPVTIEHKYGSTEVSEAPERVVTVGYSDHDAVLALGVKPIAVREWFGEKPHATWSWAQDELGDADPEVLGVSELNYEKIAALRPDLILAVYGGLTEQEYAKLAAIVPTVAQPDEYPNYGVPWQEQTRIIGRALGREDRADELVDSVEAKFAQVREDHPEFKGASAVAAAGEPGSYYVYGPEDPRSRFLTSLGFELPSEVVKVVPKDAFGTEISKEQLSIVDGEVLLWFVFTEDEKKNLEADPLHQQLTAAKGGRLFFLGNEDPPLGGALSFSTVLSLPFALDQLVPQLASALDEEGSTPG